MSDFVEQCRREWKRLGVPGPLAEEMAADLATDLQEAEADGVSVEEFLGSSAFDPQSFAASWAAGRGIVPPPVGRENVRRRPLVLVAFTAFAAIALIVSALLLATGQPKVSVVASRTARGHLVTPPAAFFVQPGTRRLVLPPTSASTPVEWILLIVAIAALGFAAWLWWTRGRPAPPIAPA
jgi:hypothetical protein